MKTFTLPPFLVYLIISGANADNVAERYDKFRTSSNPAEMFELLQEMNAEINDGDSGLEPESRIEVQKMYELGRTGYDKCDWQNFTQSFKLDDTMIESTTANLTLYVNHFKNQQIDECLTLAIKRFLTFPSRIPLKVLNEISRFSVSCNLWIYSLTRPIPREALGACILSDLSNRVRLNRSILYANTSGLPAREYGMVFYDKVVNLCNKFTWLGIDLSNEITWLSSGFSRQLHRDEGPTDECEHWLIKLKVCEVIIDQSVELIQETYSRLEERYRSIVRH